MQHSPQLEQLLQLANSCNVKGKDGKVEQRPKGLQFRRELIPQTIEDIYDMNRAFAVVSLPAAACLTRASL